MTIVFRVARIVFGVLFILAAAMGFFSGHPPAMPGLTGVLVAALYESHWSFAVAFAQLVAGVLLVVNRYVPAALIILAAFLYNSLVFHAFTMPATLPIPLVVVALWLLVSWPYRRAFAVLFTTRGS